MGQAPEGCEVGGAVEGHEGGEVGLREVYAGGSGDGRECEGEDVVGFVEGV